MKPVTRIHPERTNDWRAPDPDLDKRPGFLLIVAAMLPLMAAASLAAWVHDRLQCFTKGKSK